MKSDKDQQQQIRVLSTFYLSGSSLNQNTGRWEPIIEYAKFKFWMHHAPLCSPRTSVSLSLERTADILNITISKELVRIRTLNSLLKNDFVVDTAP